MTQVSIPSQLRELMVDSPYEAPTIALSEAVGTVLEDNSMPFFPAYTDHGTAHVEGVLDTALKLIPEAVWEQGLLAPEDAAVLACGAMLHDLAMHVREAGFVELVGADTRYVPCQWFDEPRPGRDADLLWPRLWEEFQREARHFGVGQLDLILGGGAGVPAVAHQADLDPGAWTDADRLLIGEFLRRHHARLAHEIARHGFPGASPDAFPSLLDAQADLGEAAGVLARSHNEPMRLMREHLEYLAPGSKRPKGALLLYEMGLLRIADYLQLESDRAPLLLLRLKDPQSPRSVEEWKSHAAVSSLVWDHEDPRAVYVSVAAAHGLRTHLALADLFAGLQREMDTTSAVLDAEFGAGDLSALTLGKRRILTDLEEASLHKQLPYVPRRAALRSDSDLFRLVVGDLYGRQPSVAGRELVQNAVDAVRARRWLEVQTGEEVDADELRELEADVVVTVEAQEDDRWVLRVADRGVGMTPEVVIEYFLQAGASFGPTRAELEGLSAEQSIETLKTGRFGVGAFAAFLLGPEIRVTTRHASADRGVSFRARIDGDLVQLDWAEAPIGTEVEVPFDPSTLPPKRWSNVEQTPERLLHDIADFYRLEEPTVEFVHRADGKATTSGAPADVPQPDEPLPDGWREVPAENFDAVLWRVPKQEPFYFDEFSDGENGALVQNGILIHDPTDPLFDETGYDWSDRAAKKLLRRPSLAVFDSRHLLPVTLHRYRLGDPRLPFERRLLESIGVDLAAHALVTGTAPHPLQAFMGYSGAFSRTTWLPLLPSLLERHLRAPLFVVWQYGDTDRMPSDLPSARAFFRRESTVSWRQVPHRASFNLEEFDPREIEFEEWESALEGVRIASMEWAAFLGGEVLATAVIRGDATWDGKGSLMGSGPHSYPNWRGIDAGGSIHSSGIFLEGNEATDPSVEETLLEAAHALRHEMPRGTLAMTAFGNFSQPDGAVDEALAGAWIEHVGGPIERSPSKRAQRTEEVLASAPQLRPLVEAWRRTHGT